MWNSTPSFPPRNVWTLLASLRSRHAAVLLPLLVQMVVPIPSSHSRLRSAQSYGSRASKSAAWIAMDSPRGSALSARMVLAVWLLSALRSPSRRRARTRAPRSDTSVWPTTAPIRTSFAVAKRLVLVAASARASKSLQTPRRRPERALVVKPQRHAGCTAGVCMLCYVWVEGGPNGPI